ncbi:MAG: hypothetical protein AB7Q29_07475 [Vicinamibacterales bacterium]
MSPILVRPVREQLEHDRVIRLLHAKSRRRYDAAMNPGTEKNAAVGSGSAAMYPDLVLQSPERGRRLQVVVEVETGESVNHLEALAQWAHFARLRAAFHLYVPSGMVDVARRLCEDNHIEISEIWSFHSIGDDVRFTLIHKSKEVPAPPPAPRRAAKPTPASTPRRKAAAPAPAKRPAGRVAKGTAPRRKAAAAKKTSRPQKRK